MALSEDVTIEDVLNKLYDAEHYLRKVIGNMNRIRMEHGAAVVRIGTTGAGVAPHYRVDPGRLLDSLRVGEDGIDRELFEAHFVAFHGRSHKQLEWSMGELRGEHWSTVETTWDEVRELLRSILP